MTAKAILEEELKKIESRVIELNWKDPALYSDWLAQSFHFVKHSVSLLGLTVAELDYSQRSLVSRFGSHIAEELGHEQLCIKDLEKMSLNIESFEEFNSTKLFYRNQYFGIKNVSPYYLFGYIMLLEGFAIDCGPEIQSQTSQASLSNNFVKVHVEEDENHFEEILRITGEVPKEHLGSVSESIRISGMLYRNILEELALKHQLN